MWPDYQTLAQLTAPQVLFKYYFIIPYTCSPRKQRRIISIVCFQWLIQWLFFSFLVSEHLLAQYNAIKMLHSRVKMILEYAKAVKNGNTHSLLLCAWRKMPTTLNLSLVIVKSFHNLFLFFFFSGEAPCNHEIMRDALSLIQRLPVMKTDLFREDFYNVGWLSFYKVLCVVVNPLIPNIQLSILPFSC